jgi:hypothetical protein
LVLGSIQGLFKPEKVDGRAGLFNEEFLPADA